MHMFSLRYNQHFIPIFASWLSLLSASLTSDGTARIASIYYNDATDYLKSVDDMQDKARFLLLELITCGSMSCL
jgi:hypothetical protein